MVEDHFKLFIISDGTAETASKISKAALLQFDEPGVLIRRFASIREPEALDPLIERAAQEEAVVVYTLVAQEMRERLLQRAYSLGVPTVDLLGPLLGVLAQYFHRRPEAEPGRLHRVDEAYFRRIEAIEFTVKHDDGQNLRGLKRAEILLIGVSRTSKTPLSIYLAHEGWRVSNIPIVLGIPLPKELDGVDQRRILGLAIEADRLLELRRERLRRYANHLSSRYADMDHIAEELEYAHRLFRMHPEWPVIDVTGKAIEETATEVLDLIGRRLGSKELARKLAGSSLDTEGSGT